MTARAGRLLGQIIGWSIVIVAVLVCGLLALPLVLLGWLGAAVVQVLRVLLRDGEVDGSVDGGEPDALTPELRDEIDGAARVLSERLDVERELDCGCPRDTDPKTECVKCGYTSCQPHSPMRHYCVDDELPRRGAALPPAVAASVNAAFAAVVGGSDLADLRAVDEDLAKYYLIGDEK